MHALINDVLSLLSKTIDKRIIIQTDYGSPQAMLLADAAQLHSAILNLGVNACQAMPEGGTLNISTCKKVYEDDQTLSNGQVLSAGCYLIVKLRDSGCGIDPTLIERIFTPFFTTKKQGTGLGLAAVYSTIHQHQGAIAVESQIGIGSTFTLWLPMDEHLASPSSHSSPQPISGSGTILVIDDEAVMRSLASAILSHLGYQVLVAENGRQALRVYKQRGDINLIILDMVMPEMNGSEFLRELRQIAPNIPVIVLTGYSDEEHLDDAQSLGVQAILNKPYRIEALAALISQTLDQPTSHTEESLSGE